MVLGSSTSVPLGCLRYSLTMRSNFAAGRMKLVSCIPSGSRMFFWKYCSSVKPLTVSTSRPLQSALVPYCQREPGSNISGVSGATVPSGMLTPLSFS